MRSYITSCQNTLSSILKYMIMLLSASLLLICSDAIATAQAPLTNTNVNTKAEQWVNERLRSGKPADLQAKFSERERSISAKCIEDIIRDKGSNGILNNKGMSIANADIVDILDLESLTIRYPIRFNHCNFASNVNFIRSKFCNDLWFYDCTFEAVTSFTSIVVDKDFTIVNCNFVKAGSFCITHGTVNKQLFINDSNFDCDSSFFDNVKLGDLIAFRAKFNGSSVSFIGMTVNKSADFTSAIFLGKTSFNNVIIGNNMIFKNAIFKNNNSKYFQGMQVKGEGNYYDSEINCPMHLEGSSFDTLRLPKEELVKIDHSIHLDYVKYRYICIGNCNINEKPSDNLLHYFNSKCSYHVTIYKQLEEFSKLQWNPDLADKIFIDQHRRERKETTMGFLSWLRNILFDGLVGYGRFPEKSLIPSIIIMLLGMLIFKREQDMEVQNPQDIERHKGKYSCFWYSVDLFIPVIGLKSASIWVPKDPKSFRYQYMRLHMILGWLLVPLFIGAWTGIIK